MNVKEFKQRWLNSKIEPELFYMPVKSIKRNNQQEINKLWLETSHSLIHTNGVESYYHGWSKQCGVFIDNTEIIRKNEKTTDISVNKNWLIGEEKEEHWDIEINLLGNVIGSGEGWSNMITHSLNSYGGNRIDATVELYKDTIRYYGVWTTLSSSSDHVGSVSSNHSEGNKCIYPDRLEYCVSSSKSSCSFTNINKLETTTLKLLDVYPELRRYLDSNNYYYGNVFWFVFYDCKDNSLKSYLSVSSETEYGLNEWSICEEINKAYNSDTTLTIKSNYF